MRGQTNGAPADSARRPVQGLEARSARALFLVVHDLVIGFHDIIRLPAAGASRLLRPSTRSSARLTGPAGRTLLLIQRLASLTIRGRQLFLRRTNLVRVGATQSLPRPLDRGVKPSLEVGRQAVRPLLGILLR